MESEIFGHVKGAFTGASGDRKGAALQADGGTLFLDEVAEMDLGLQSKLLRFLQEKTVQRVGEDTLRRADARIVCATNRDPLAEVSAGRFREDLFYRLHVVPVEMPPLRDREGDVLLLAQHFLKVFSQEDGKSFKGFSPDAEAALLAYAWPGNIRQLQNVVRSVVVLNDAEAVTADMLPRSLLPGSVAAQLVVARRGSDGGADCGRRRATGARRGGGPCLRRDSPAGGCYSRDDRTCDRRLRRVDPARGRGAASQPLDDLSARRGLAAGRRLELTQRAQVYCLTSMV